jgi:hypothetical protein
MLITYDSVHLFHPVEHFATHSTSSRAIWHFDHLPIAAVKLWKSVFNTKDRGYRVPFYYLQNDRMPPRINRDEIGVRLLSASFASGVLYIDAA